jgi:hypothetical protein
VRSCSCPLSAPMMPLSPNETVKLDVQTRTPFPAVPAIKSPVP